MHAPINSIVAALAALAIAQPVAAAPFAAQTGVATLSPCPSFCGGIGGFSEFDIDGGEGFAFSQSLIPAGVNGTGAAVASLSGSGLRLPVLGADAFSEADSRVGSEAGGMQQYTYAGPSSLFTLDLVLDGSVGEGSQPPDANLFVNTIVFLASDIDFSSDYGTFRFENIPLNQNPGGSTILAESEINFQALGLVDQGFQSANDSLNFTLEDGDRVYIWASLQADGTRGGFANGGSTFGMSFSAGNVAGLTPVPLPAPLLLFGSALGVLALRRARTHR